MNRIQLFSTHTAIALATVIAGTVFASGRVPWAAAQETSTFAFSSRASEDGYVRESAERSGKGGKVLLFGNRRGARANADGAGGAAILVGDDGSNRQLKGVLSFDTAPLPDNARILQASLQLTRGRLVGNPAGLGELFVDIRTGSFGDASSLEPRDFEASADLNRVALVPLASGTFSIELPASSLQAISLSGRTQLRLSFGKPTNRDKKAAQIGFFSGEALREGDRPVLSIVYTSIAAPPPLPTSTPGVDPTIAPTATVAPTLSPTPVSTGIWKPRPGTSWQWQLTGNLDTSLPVDMFDIDLFTTPQATISALKQKGRIVICYFSAGSYEDFRPDKTSFPTSVLGKTNGWPGERWLDVRQLAILGPIMKARLDLAVQKGCDGVEPDNVDGYSNASGFSISYADQLAYNRFIAAEAHARGLSVGLKNDLDQVKDLVSHFDWALNEQCFQYNECDLLLPFVKANKAVFGVEYKGDVSAFCPKANANDFDWLKKSLELDAARTACR